MTLHGKYLLSYTLCQGGIVIIALVCLCVCLYVSKIMKNYTGFHPIFIVFGPGSNTKQI